MVLPKVPRREEEEIKLEINRKCCNCKIFMRSGHQLLSQRLRFVLRLVPLDFAGLEYFVRFKVDYELISSPDMDLSTILLPTSKFYQ